ncbi:MAG TPA: hypothetical protein IGS53_25915 [Leptolyngbyaceae cyanobacterium M33_DOE_097]|uniref:Uncharacterized protein n=1 Tax=Oscillatoriales cyanobacterium SpSt-418 TaxID=2282169 RepID=A0A7C3KJI1_9CYAN|nr:hypothetical protein [Leptolyngbyaceae cyanobacterium M33_DOE_097]
MLERLLMAGFATFTLALFIQTPANLVDQNATVQVSEQTQKVAQLFKDAHFLQNLFERKNYGM